MKLDRIQSSFKEHFQPIVFQKVVGLETREVLYEKVCMSPRPPPKIPPRHDHDWTKESGSKVDRQPEGEVVRQTTFFQTTNQLQIQFVID